MRLKLGNSGDMIKTDNILRKTSLREVDQELNKKKIFKKSFINYLSLGYDARVGYGFDKSRSSSRCLNKFIYFWEGLKKNCCTKTAGINSIIEKFEEVEENIEENNFDKNKVLNQNEINLNFEKTQNKLDKSSNQEYSIIGAENERRKIIFIGKPEGKDISSQTESMKSFFN